jgi:hypothetical protein
VDSELLTSDLSFEIPQEVVLASSFEWEVLVDAFLVNAAKVGNRYTGSVFSDRSGQAADGMTVITPPVLRVAQRDGMTLVRTLCGGDYYVIASAFSLTNTEVLHTSQKRS